MGSEMGIRDRLKSAPAMIPGPVVASQRRPATTRPPKSIFGRNIRPFCLPPPSGISGIPPHPRRSMQLRFFSTSRRPSAKAKNFQKKKSHHYVGRKNVPGIDCAGLERLKMTLDSFFPRGKRWNHSRIVALLSLCRHPCHIISIFGSLVVDFCNRHASVQSAAPIIYQLSRI